RDSISNSTSLPFESDGCANHKTIPKLEPLKPFPAKREISRFLERGRVTFPLHGGPPAAPELAGEARRLNGAAFADHFKWRKFPSRFEFCFASSIVPYTAIIQATRPTASASIERGFACDASDANPIDPRGNAASAPVSAPSAGAAHM